MTPKRPKRSVNWRSLAAAAVLCACVTPAVGNTAAHAAPLRGYSPLLQQAASHPGSSFRVIIQKRGSSTLPESLIQQAGGRITKQLSIIDALAATVPGRLIHQLAASQSVNWVSPDAVVRREGGPDGPVNTANLLNHYDAAIGADRMWAQGYQGSGVNVAVVDSGITPTPDLGSSRLVDSVSLVSSDATTTDQYGHGSHVAGIIGGNGALGGGKYVGIAPKVGVIDVKIFDSQGAATTSDVVNGLQWVYDHAQADNIRVVNLSLDTTVAQSYNVDPVDAACEILWFNKIVVVAAAGNNQKSNPGVLYAPANDPFVITVGAVNDHGTNTTSDDTVAPFSAYGTTADGFGKPDVVAPGTDIVSVMASSSDYLATHHPTHIDGSYFDMSGTSMATAVVTGAAALMLERAWWLNPDQVKYLLMAYATPLPGQAGAGAGEINVYAASHGWTASANTGLLPSSALETGSGTGFITWDSASWGSASWGSASWGSVSWGSASWGSAVWDSDYWGPTTKHPLGLGRSQPGARSGAVVGPSMDNVQSYNG
ncbi:MAG TPA: S8 family serine peptidase [Chloroflexota bacterium]|nr:S8 family serine peptidase [Chloroflexota bacterium]